MKTTLPTPWLKKRLVFVVGTCALTLFLLILFTPRIVSRTAPAMAPLPGSDRPLVAHDDVNQAFLNLPLRFVANAGQADPAARFIVKGAGHTLFFTGDEIVFTAVGEPQRITESADRSFVADRSSVMRLRFPGANASPIIEGHESLPGASNFFLGNDPAQWQVNVPTYGAVTYRNLYPGIDLIYRGTEGRLKSEFHLAAGADPAMIQLAYEGVEDIQVRLDGALVLQTSRGELIEEAPLIYQEVNGVRQVIPGSYVLLDLPGAEKPAGRVVGFRLAAYDPALPLVIDPVLSFSSYLGGSANEEGRDIAVDEAGNIYVTGYTSSSDFPTQNALDASLGGSRDVFVTQIISASGVYTYGYSTYLGGSGFDDGYALAVDIAGNAYVAGYTSSSDFPTRNAVQPTYRGNDVFVTQIISASGVYTLGYSTYLGGSSIETGYGIAVDGVGNVYVTGETWSADFPTRNALDASRGGTIDAFVTQVISASGVYTYGYSTYLGGSGNDHGNGIAVDSAGNAYVAGYTQSSDFPTQNALDTTLGGSQDAFVTHIISASSVYTYGYSTYLGGSGVDYGNGIGVDGAGNAYVVGQTQSSDFPTRNALDTTFAGGSDAFVTQIISASGVSTYGYSTYWGGSSGEWGNDIVVDGAGNSSVTGYSSSTDFPIRNGIQFGYGGGSEDAFVTQIINVNGIYTDSYSTYLGGSGTDQSYGIVVDNGGNAWVVGQTLSSNFPTRDALDTTLGGSQDAFIAKLGLARPSLLGFRPARNSHTAPLTTTVSLTYDEPLSAATVTSRTVAVHAMQTGLVTATHGVNGNTIIVTPTRPLHQGELAYVIATTRTLNLAGTGPLSTTHWQFNAGVVQTRCVGSFTNIGASLPDVANSSVAWGDYDQDGDLDILLAGNVAGIMTRVYRNVNGVFSDSTAGLPGVEQGSVAWGDYDNDGDLDILLTGEQSSSVELTRIYRNDNGVFTDINAGLIDLRWSAAAWGDYDNDGDLDVLLTGNYEDTSMHYVSRIYRNADGVFTDINAGLIGVDRSAVAWGDYDNDGYLDVLLAGGYTGSDRTTRLYHNNGNGTFTNINAGLTGVWGGSVVWGDYNSDGFLDILLTGWTSTGRTAQVYRNNGNGAFIDINAGLTNVGSSSAVWGDYDNDGTLDILLTGVNASGVRVSRVYRNTGFGTFTDIGANLKGVAYSSAAWGDYDNDNDLDILITGDDGTAPTWAIVYRNDDCAADLALVKTVKPSVAVPGRAVTYTLTFSNAGSLTATGVLITDVVPISITNISYTFSGVSITETANVSYTWQAGSLAPGAGGVITITGILSSDLSAGSIFTNTAVITTPSTDVNTGNNSRAVSVTVSDETRCGLAVGTYHFNITSTVQIGLTTLGTLDCLTVKRLDANHPNATAGIQTGRYWAITGTNGLGEPAGGFSADLTLPATFVPDDTDKVCRYIGPNQIWDCVASHYDPASQTITRDGVTAFSDWAVGRHVGPTAITLLGLRATPHSDWLGLGVWAGVSLTILWWLRRRHQRPLGK